MPMKETSSRDLFPMFGSLNGAIGRQFRISDGTLAQVVGIVEDGKYLSLTEDQEPAILMPSMLYDDPQSYVIVRSARDPQEMQALMRAKLRKLDAGLLVDIQSWNQLLEVVQFPAKVATMALGVLGLMGAVLSITAIFGTAAYPVASASKNWEFAWLSEQSAPRCSKARSADRCGCSL